MAAFGGSFSLTFIKPLCSGQKQKRGVFLGYSLGISTDQGLPWEFHKTTHPSIKCHWHSLFAWKLHIMHLISLKMGKHTGKSHQKGQSESRKPRCPSPDQGTRKMCKPAAMLPCLPKDPTQPFLPMLQWYRDTVLLQSWD